MRQFGASTEKESRATRAGASRPAFNDLAMVMVEHKNSFKLLKIATSLCLHLDSDSLSRWLALHFFTLMLVPGFACFKHKGERGRGKKVEIIMVWIACFIDDEEIYIHGKNYTLNAHNAPRGLSLVGQVAPL